VSSVKNTSDSYNALLVQLQITTSDGSVFEVPAHQYLRSFSIEEKDGAAWTGSVVLFDRAGETLEELFVLLGKDRSIKVQWGWDRPGVSLSSYPLYFGGIGTYENQFTEDGVEVTLNAIAKEALDAVLDKKDRSYPAGAVISDIVAEIAADRGWVTEVDGKTTIEPTAVPLTEPISAHNDSDLQFISKHLVPHAVDQDGNGFDFYFARGAFHFHSRDWMFKNEAEASKVPIAAYYKCSRDSLGGEVISFSPEDGALAAAINGGENCLYVSVDAKSGAKLQIKTDKSGVPGAVTTLHPDEGRVTSLGEGNFATIPISAVDADDFEAQVKRRHSRLRSSAYKATLEVRGTHAVEILQFVRVDYITHSGKVHYLSGVFQVFGIEHSVSPGEWTTTFSLARGGVGAVSEQGEAEKVTADKQVLAETTDTTQGVRAERKSKAGQSSDYGRTRKRIRS